jgi:hypothetical protein
VRLPQTHPPCNALPRRAIAPLRRAMPPSEARSRPRAAWSPGGGWGAAPRCADLCGGRAGRRPRDAAGRVWHSPRRGGAAARSESARAGGGRPSGAGPSPRLCGVGPRRRARVVPPRQHRPPQLPLGPTPGACSRAAASDTGRFRAASQACLCAARGSRQPEGGRHAPGPSRRRGTRRPPRAAERAAWGGPRAAWPHGGLGGGGTPKRWRSAHDDRGGSKVPRAMPRAGLPIGPVAQDHGQDPPPTADERMMGATAWPQHADAWRHAVRPVWQRHGPRLPGALVESATAAKEPQEGAVWKGVTCSVIA